MGCVARLNSFIRGIDPMDVPAVGRLQLTLRFQEDGEILSKIPRIPLWIMVQPSYHAISAHNSPAASPSPEAAKERGAGKKSVPRIAGL